MPSFEEISCNQHWPKNNLRYASAGLVSYNNTKELMLCGGSRMTGCYIWTEQGWIQSDTTFFRLISYTFYTFLLLCFRFRAAASETSGGLLVTGGIGDWGVIESTILFTTAWQDLTDLPGVTKLHCQITVGNTVYVVGGGGNT